MSRRPRSNGEESPLDVARRLHLPVNGGEFITWGSLLDLAVDRYWQMRSTPISRRTACGEAAVRRAPGQGRRMTCDRCFGAGVIPGSYDPLTNSWDDHECPVCDGWGGPVCAVCSGPLLDDSRYCGRCQVTGLADVWVTDREAW